MYIPSLTTVLSVAFLGYMANKLVKGSLGVINEDDRDYYGKKRLDMAGSLLGNNFR